jgi:glycosyltransferase involved in cell wall biosynthesis
MRQARRLLISDTGIQMSPTKAAEPEPTNVGVHTPERPIRILAFFESYGIMGAAKPVLEFAQEAASTGDRNIELSTLLFVRGKEENPLIDIVRGRGVPIDFVNERYAWDLQTFPQLRAIVEKRRPDIIWTNNSKSHFLARVTGLHRQAAWVAFHHGHTKGALRTRLYHELDRWSLRAANRVVTVCDYFARDLQRMGVPAGRISVQHNPIRLQPPASEEEKLQLRAELGPPDGAKVLLNIGRLSLEKGHADLLRAMARLRQEGSASDVYLLILGAGPEKDALLALRTELGLNNVVQFCGQIADVHPYYGIADLFVLPSHSEGSPNVLLEALAAELPIVATDAGGVPELLTHEVNALLVPKQDVPQLAGAIRRLLDDPALRQHLSDNCKDAVARHDPRSYFQSILGIFEQVVRETRAA